MKTVTLDVRTPADAMADFTQAWNTGKSEKSDRISFASPELIWRVLTAKRWDLLKVLYPFGKQPAVPAVMSRPFKAM